MAWVVAVDVDAILIVLRTEMNDGRISSGGASCGYHRPATQYHGYSYCFSS